MDTPKTPVVTIAVQAAHTDRYPDDQRLGMALRLDTSIMSQPSAAMAAAVDVGCLLRSIANADPLALVKDVRVLVAPGFDPPPFPAEVFEPQATGLDPEVAAVALNAIEVALFGVMMRRGRGETISDQAEAVTVLHALALCGMLKAAP